MVDLPRHSVSVAGIITNEKSQILIIKRRDNGEWQPPGGVLELGETIEDGLRREVLEETGVEVSVGEISGVYKNVKDGIVAIVCRCRHIAGKPHATEEAVEARWILPEEAHELMRPIFALRVADAFNDQKRGAMQRSHDGTVIINR